LASDLLSVEEIVGGYGKLTVLNGTTFKVARGAITTVIGPNGAGKSTVFKAIFGLLRVARGRIAFDGRDITNLEPRALLGLGISYVPQGRNVFPELSVLHNLELGATVAPAALGSIGPLTERFPMLGRKRHVQASTLSGGEQKLLEIARGLLLEPKLMLIDEPSIGLSPIMVNELFGILTEMRERGITVLLIEQNAKRALESSDYGIVLELGRTRIADTARNILSDPRIGQLFLGGGLAEKVA
jgi:branched-chain amino acid transport system ATP-binding protein